jgi:hypothetical protein
MADSRDKKFSELIETVAKELIATEHDKNGSFIRTPLTYPSGSLVVIRVHRADDKRFFVSDWGLGYQEADLTGSAIFYARHANPIAAKAGVNFDNQAFFVMEASREQLAGAVVTIANCSQEATIRAADSLAEKTFEDSKERLYERLVSVFRKEMSLSTRVVAKNIKVVGQSTTEWPIATIVRLPGFARATIFEPVTKHHHSVASASMKFNDIARLGQEAPARVAMVQNKNEFGTLLGVLSQAANVVDEGVPDTIIERLAKAA